MFSIRRAGPADVAVIARHRAMMFKDMRILAAEAYPRLLQDTERALAEIMSKGEYFGWLAVAEAGAKVIGGAGVQLRRTLPFPGGRPVGSAVSNGRQALVINVFTEPEWRRRGVARCLMEAVLSWAREVGIESVVLHASAEGRGLYDQLGFVATNEMRYQGDS